MSRSCDCPVRRWAKRFFLFVFAVAVVSVPVAYFGVPKVARSEWARRKAEKEASAALGTQVRIAKLDFSWRGGFVASDVSTDALAVGDMDASWTVREIQFRPKPFHLCSSHPKASATLVEPRMLMRWRGDASMKAGCASDPGKACAWSGKIKALKLYSFTIERGSVLIDHPTFIEPVRIEDLHAQGHLDARRDEMSLDVDRLVARLNGGGVSASGRLQIARDGASGRVSLTAENVDVNEFVVEGIRNLQPMIDVEAGGIQKGGMDIRFDGETQASNVSGLLRGLAGRGSLRIFNADIQRSRILHSVGEALGMPGLAVTRIQSIAQTFAVKSGRVHLEEMLAQASEGALTMSGWIEFGGPMDVTVRLDPRLGQGPREPVRVIGTPKRPEAAR